jgi:serine/threonine-protein kinase
MNCPRCHREIDSGASSCSSCGFSFEEATQRLAVDQSPSKKTKDSQPQSLSSFDSIDDSRFVPGTILAERYRIIGLLGKGGMGEVYRADDLKLAQPVALKFLPEHLLSDGAALARFHREVRVARQVSHKNVCRVYDIGEIDQRQFLSMEFIKGEELSSLLRRIGRVPRDKAIQIARQICAGLSAAHEIGVMHRDLKPSNIMIDERGNARITDFGLAGLEEELHRENKIAGTPAYMAPEQLEGQTFTVRSDIYSLGLLLYELFTGKKAFDAPTLGELIRLRRSDTAPATPTSIIKDLDPLIEKVIDRCIQKDPELRPSSALQVAAALPGGDPIAAALAAGETPSPEMVAAAPKKGVLKPAIGTALFAAFVALIVLCAWLTKYTAVYRLTPMEQSPEVLRAHAEGIVKQFGYTDQPIDSASGVVLKNDLLRYIAAHDQSISRWSRLRTQGAYRFWYRQSPRYFTTIEDIDQDTPALDVSGMTLVYLDMVGHLHWFIGVPPQREPSANINDSAPDWSVPFREAGLEIASFQPVVSTFVPLHASDVRMAWEGSDPAQPDLKVHIEAAAFHGKLVYFETIYPWDQPTREELPPESKSARAMSVIWISVFVLAIVGSVLLARRNLHLGRGDRRGASRLALFVFVVTAVLALLGEHHNGLLAREFRIFVLNIAGALFFSAFFWLMYIALEPFVRRQWPERIIAWSRLLAGGFRDPLVGRDILLGSVFGSSIALCFMLTSVGLRWIGRAPQLILSPANVDAGSSRLVTKLITQIDGPLMYGFIGLFLLLLFVLLLRHERLGLLALWILLLGFITVLTQTNIRMLPFAGLAAAIVVFTLARFGLLATFATMFFFYFWALFPFTTDITAWYATQFLIDGGLCLGLASYGFYTSLGGQPLFGENLLRD